MGWLPTCSTTIFQQVRTQWLGWMMDLPPTIFHHTSYRQNGIFRLPRCRTLTIDDRCDMKRDAAWDVFGFGHALWACIFVHYFSLIISILQQRYGLSQLLHVFFFIVWTDTTTFGCTTDSVSVVRHLKLGFWRLLASMFVLIAVHVLDGVLNFDSIIGVWYMWTVGVTRIARHSKFGVDSSSFQTLCFYVQRFKLFWVCLRSVCFCSFLATPYTAFQMTVGSLPWATPRTRFLIAQCFRLPLLPRFASMMARTFNDV